MIKILIYLLVTQSLFTFFINSDTFAYSFNFIENKAIKGIRKSIKKGSLDRDFVRRTNRKGRTPLFYAVKYGSHHEVQFLIDNEAELNIKDLLGKSVVVLAIERVNDNMIKFLFTRGFEFNFLDPMLKQAISKIKGKKKANKILSTLSLIYTVKKLFLFDNQQIPHSLKDEKNNFGTKVCNCCNEKFSHAGAFSSKIVLCQECSNTYLAYALNNAGIEQISYPVIDENSPLHKKEIGPIFLLEIGIDHQDFFRYLRAFTTRKLHSKEKWKFCHGHDCLNGLEIDDFTKGKCLDCDICGFKGCLNCGFVHEGNECELTVLSYSGIKACPGCGTHYQKVSGCNVITCPGCFTSWTWNDKVIRNTDYQDGAHITPFRYKGGDLDEIRRYGDIDGFFSKE